MSESFGAVLVRFVALSVGAGAGFLVFGLPGAFVGAIFALLVLVSLDGGGSTDDGDT